MENTKKNNIIVKKWTNINGNGNGNGNGHNSNGHNGNGHHPAITYKTSSVSEKPYFTIGDTWSTTTDGIVSSFRVLAIEDIIIPAGKYKCFKISEEINSSGIKNYYWFATNVGLIKCEIGRVTAVLQNYTSSESFKT